MLATSFSLALLTTAGCIAVYSKLPRRVRKFIEKHALMADFICLIGIYMLLGGTLTALFAGAMAGLMISVMLHVANNEDDYLYLYDLRDYVKDRLKDAKVALNAYGETYRMRKEQVVEAQIVAG